jgi:hypothetical protein
LGYIPGRSFVGRVLECGWDVRDEVVRKGEWVVGLLDVRKVYIAFSSSVQRGRNVDENLFSIIRAALWPNSSSSTVAEFIVFHIPGNPPRLQMILLDL